MALAPVVPQQPTSIFDTSANQLNQAGSIYGRIGQGGAPAASMNSYLNPYQNQVIDATVGRMTDSRDQALNQVGAQADAAGAFGGSRFGQVESNIYDTSQRNIGEAVSAMNQQGFNTAAGLGMQDVNQQLNAAGGLMGASDRGFGRGMDINAQQMQQGGLQQQLLQQILGMGNNQFQQYMNSPTDALNQQLAALNGNPLSREQINTTTPGLFDYLSLIMQAGGQFGQGMF